MFHKIVGKLVLKWNIFMFQNHHQIQFKYKTNILQLIIHQFHVTLLPHKYFNIVNSNEMFFVQEKHEKWKQNREYKEVFLYQLSGGFCCCVTNI